MAWAFLQSASNSWNSGGAQTATYGTNLSSGSTLIAICCIYDTTTTAVKDAAGNSFTEIASVLLDNTAGDGELSVWALETPSGDVGTKPVITMTTATAHDNGAMLIQEVSGITATADGTPGTTYGTGTPAGPPVYSSTASNEYLLYCYGDNGNSTTVTFSSGWTKDSSSTANFDADIAAAYKNSTGGTESGTCNASSPWGLIMVAFKPISNPITHVGDSTYVSGTLTGKTQTNTYSSTAGNTLVAYALGYINGNNSLSLSSVTDTAGNTWTVVNGTIGYYSADNYSACTAIAYCVDAAPVTSVTATWSAIPNNIAWLQVSEFSNVPSGALTDGNASQSYAGTSVSSVTTPSITPTASTDIVLGITASNATWSSSTPGTGLLDSLANWNIITNPGVGYDVTFTGSNNLTATQTVAIGAGTSGSPTITTTSLPEAPIGYMYSASLEATGGATPYTWSVSSGSLPSWASLTGSTISGTPTGSPTTTSFTVEVTDANSNIDTQPLSITTVAVQALQSAWPGVPAPGLFVPGELITQGTAPVQHNVSITGTVTTTGKVIRQVKKILLFGGGTGATSTPGWVAIPGLMTPGADIPGDVNFETTGSSGGGGLSVSGTIVASRGAIVHMLTVAAYTITNAAITRRVSKSVLGAVTAIRGTVTRATRKTITGTTVTTAAASRIIKHILTVITGVYGLITATKHSGTIQVTLTAILAVTASTQNMIGRVLAGQATLKGILRRNISINLPYPLLSVTASTSRKITHTLAAFISSIGSVVAGKTGPTLVTLVTQLSVSGITGRKISRPVTAVAATTVSLTRSITRQIVAVVTLTSALRRMKLMMLNAAVVGASLITRQAGKPLSTATVTKSTVTRQVKRILNGSIGVTSAVIRGVTRTLTSPVPVSAVITSIKFKIVTLTVNIVVNSTITRSVSRAFAGTTSTTVKVARGCGRKVNSSVTLIPVAVRGITRFLSTSTTITASTVMIKFKQVILTVLTVVDSTVTRATGKLTIAEVAVTGTVKRFISFTIPVVTALYGIIGTGGSLYRVTLASMIALKASVTRITGKLTTGTIITTGTTRRALSFRLNAVTTATGVTIRNVSRKITGFSAVTASVVQSKLKLLTLLAVTAITGVLRQTSNRSFLITVNMTVSAATRKLLNLHLNAPITVSSVVYRQLRKTITSTLVIISSSAKGIFHTITLSASVTFTAALSTLKARGIILVSALAVTITVKRGIYRNLNVSATMASGAIRVINRAIQGNLTVAGQTLRGMTRKLTSTVTIRSVLSFSHGYIITVNTFMSVSGSVKRNVRVIEMTVIGVSTDVTRFLRKNIIVPLITFATTIAGRPHVMTLTTGISVTISVTAKFLSTSKVIVIKTGLLAIRWITGQIKSNWRV